jgi:hypothetical protein
VGNSWGSVNNGYNTGNVNGSGSYVGGVVGENNGPAVNCYYLTGTAARGLDKSADATTSKTTDEMKSSGFVTELNQTSNGMNPFAFKSGDYPTLKKECVKLISGGAKVGIGGYGGSVLMRGYVDENGKADKWELTKTKPQFFAKPGYKLSYVHDGKARINLNSEDWQVTKTGINYLGDIDDLAKYTVIFKRDE